MTPQKDNMILTLQKQLLEKIKRLSTDGGGDGIIFIIDMGDMSVYI